MDKIRHNYGLRLKNQSNKQLTQEELSLALKDGQSANYDGSNLLTIAYMEGAQDLVEVKRKLEIAVKGLKDVEKHIRAIVYPRMLDDSPAYQITIKCLKDLEV